MRASLTISTNGQPLLVLVAEAEAEQRILDFVGVGPAQINEEPQSRPVRMTAKHDGQFSHHRVQALTFIFGEDAA